MLVLSRKTGESIQIAENIRITVTEIRGGRVRLSIDAPRAVRIVRQEISDVPYTPAETDADASVSGACESPRLDDPSHGDATQQEEPHAGTDLSGACMAAEMLFPIA